MKPSQGLQAVKVAWTGEPVEPLPVLCAGFEPFEQMLIGGIFQSVGAHCMVSSPSTRQVLYADNWTTCRPSRNEGLKLF